MMKKKVGLAVVLSLILMLASLLYVRDIFFAWGGHYTIGYGFPLSWLIYQASGIMGVHQWLPNIVALAVDYLFWFEASFVAVQLFPSHRVMRLLLGSVKLKDMG